SAVVALSVASFALMSPAASFAAPAAPTTQPVGVQLLTNPGHEHPGVYFGGRGEINVTWNWVPFWEEPPSGDNLRDQNFRTPEFRPVFASIYPDRVLSGGGSDRWFNFFALNKAAGVMQLVSNLKIGQPVRFSTWAQLWSSNVTSNPPKSTQDGNMKVRVCIQADGGPRNMLDANLKCSEWAQPYDRYDQIYVDAVPMTTTVIALIQSTADITVQHNDAYVDDSCFEVLPKAGAKGICVGATYIPTGASAGGVAAATKVASPASSSPQLTVNTGGLNIRATPSLAGQLVGTVHRGDVLNVTGKSVDGLWFRIAYTGGPAWVYASLTAPNAAASAAAVVK
ncbi:MAG TPA: SH3 domain-containing protein, partial [Anaerolineae bacterium]